MPIVASDSSASPQSDVPPKEAPSLPPVPHRTRPKPLASGHEPAEAAESTPSNCPVGYGRPPVHTRFKPGQSGNPKGRPKGAKGLKTLARELLTAKVPVRTASGEKKMHRIEAVLHKAFELALKGNPRAQSQMISLYDSAVPERSTLEDAAIPTEELTEGDLAILAELKASWEAGR